MQPNKAATIVRQIERTLGSPLTPFETRMLADDGWMAELLDGEPIDGAVARIRQMRAWHKEGDPLEPPKPRFVTEDPESKTRSGQDLREQAVSVLLAREASTDPDVLAFRHECLTDHVMPAGAVPQWISQQVERDMESESSAAGDGPGGRLGAWRMPPAPLGFGVQAPGSTDFDAKWLAIPLRGVLERLQLLSEFLAEQYRWIEWQATMFVLAGEVPLVPALTYQVTRPLPPTEHGSEPFQGLRNVKGLERLKSTTRIVLTIDPAVAPEEVASKYSMLRAAARGSGKHRYQALSNKHVELAIFAVRRPPNESLAETLRAWNEQHPAWCYPTHRAANFSRDCAAAQRRLLHPDYRGIL